MVVGDGDAAAARRSARTVSGSEHARSMPARPSPRPSVTGTKRSVALSSGIVGTPSTSARSISTISDQRVATFVGILALHLGGRDRRHEVGADGVLPVRPGRAPRAHRVLATDLLVDLEERAAGVARVQLHVVKPSSWNWPTMRMPSSSTRARRGGVVVGLRDDHVAAVAVAPLEVALGGDALGVSGATISSSWVPIGSSVLCSPMRAMCGSWYADREAEDVDELLRRRRSSSWATRAIWRSRSMAVTSPGTVGCALLDERRERLLAVGRRR